MQQDALRQANADRGILTEDWSPLAEGEPFGESAIKDAAPQALEEPGPGDPALAPPARAAS